MTNFKQSAINDADRRQACGPPPVREEGKETEREEIVPPFRRMVLGYPEKMKSICQFYK